MSNFKIGEIAAFNARNISKKDEIKSIRYLDTSNLTENKIDELKIFNLEDAPSRAQRKVKKNDILISTVRPNQKHFGFIETNDDTLIVSSGFAVLSPNETIVNPKYLYYFLTQENITNYLQTIAEGATTSYPSIKPIDIANLQINLPPLSEQQQIADFLSSLDAKISVNDKINKELEAMSQTLYNYWFIQFDFPNKEGNPYKSNGGEMIWNEELKREIPKGWEVKKVANLVPVLTGKRDANFATTDGQYKFFTCSQEPSQCDEYEFEGNAILIAGNGDFNVKTYTGKFNAYQRTYVLIPENSCYYGYLAQLLSRNISSFKNSSQGSIVKFIKKGDIENIPVLIPNDLKLLEQFNMILNMIHANRQQNEELLHLRKFLLPMLMNSQIKLNK